jgi:hypothetical protein
MCKQVLGVAYEAVLLSSFGSTVKTINGHKSLIANSISFNGTEKLKYYSENSHQVGILKGGILCRICDITFCAHLEAEIQSPDPSEF